MENLVKEFDYKGFRIVIDVNEWTEMQAAYSYQIFDSENRQVDGCWPFYSIEECEKDAKKSIDNGGNIIAYEIEY